MKFIKLLLLVSFPILTGSCSFLPAQTIGSTEIDTTSVATGLDTPWEILWGPNGSIWFTERYGKVSRLNPESGELTELITINEVYESGESGLLGMALHPDFPDTPYIYLVYNYLDNSQIKEKLVRYTYQNELLENPAVLLEGIDGNTYHDGSRLVIDENYKLYMTTGDAGNTSTSQDTASLNGKILRMNLDGTIPEDNPFPNSYIWTLGHRNAQGLVISSGGIMYSSEHGPASDDEVNIIEKGRNYGWPDVMGYCNESTETNFCNEYNVKEPIAAWTPTLAVAGIGLYTNDAIPEWKNSILMTTLKESELVQLKLSQDGLTVEEELRWFDEWFGRLRDVCISPDGRVFIAVSNRDGRGNPKPGDDRIVEIKAAQGTAVRGNAKEASRVRLYPNPSENTLIIEIPEEIMGTVLKIYDTNGRLVFQKKNAQSIERINTKLFQPGVYVLFLEIGRNSIRKKFLIE